MLTVLFYKGLLLFGASLAHPVGKIDAVDSDRKTQGAIEVVQLS